MLQINSLWSIPCDTSLSFWTDGTSQENSNLDFVTKTFPSWQHKGSSSCTKSSRIKRLFYPSLIPRLFILKSSGRACHTMAHVTVHQKCYIWHWHPTAAPGRNFWHRWHFQARCEARFHMRWRKGINRTQPPPASSWAWTNCKRKHFCERNVVSSRHREKEPRDGTSLILVFWVGQYCHVI